MPATADGRSLLRQQAELQRAFPPSRHTLSGDRINRTYFPANPLWFQRILSLVVFTFCVRHSVRSFPPAFCRGKTFRGRGRGSTKRSRATTRRRRTTAKGMGRDGRVQCSTTTVPGLGFLSPERTVQYATFFITRSTFNRPISFPCSWPRRAPLSGSTSSSPSSLMMNS